MTMTLNYYITIDDFFYTITVIKLHVLENKKNYIANLKIVF